MNTEALLKIDHIILEVYHGQKTIGDARMEVYQIGFRAGQNARKGTIRSLKRN